MSVKIPRADFREIEKKGLFFAAAFESAWADQRKSHKGTEIEEVMGNLPGQRRGCSWLRSYKIGIGFLVQHLYQKGTLTFYVKKTGQL